MQTGRVTDKLDDNLYQKLTSIVGMNVIIQAITLFLAYLIHFINLFGISGAMKVSTGWQLFFNWAGFELMILMFNLSILVIIQIIINIFNFSQLYQFMIKNEDKKHEK